MEGSFFSGLGEVGRSALDGHGLGLRRKRGTSFSGTWELRFVRFPRRMTTNRGNGGLSPQTSVVVGNCEEVNPVGLEVGSHSLR